MSCLVCLGDVTSSKYPHYHDKCLRQLFGTTRVQPEFDFDRNQFFSEKAREFTEHVSISGVQPKLALSLQKYKLEPTAGDFTHIMKVSPENFPQLAENELLTMRISAEMGISTAICGLVPMSSGELVYCTKRYDYVSSMTKLHQEDMMQAMGVHPLLMQNAKYEAKSYEDVALSLKATSSIALVKDLFERIFFNFMVSNDDYHLKNVAILFDPKAPGGIKLAPHYDSVNTGIYGLQDSELALSLVSTSDGFTKAYSKWGFHTKLCFDEFAKRVGLPQSVCDKTYSKYFANFEKIKSLVAKSHLSSAYKQRYLDELIDRKQKFLTPVGGAP